MAMTSVPNNPANSLLPFYPNLTTQLNAQFVVADPLNGNYFVATGRDLVTFEAIAAADAPAWSAVVNYTVGMVVTVASVQYIATAPSLNQTPPNASFWALYTGSTVTISSTPDSCTGRTADVVNYPVPVFDSTQKAVEFLVVPSSVFTQANGQVQFKASSNLVYVYVRSL